MFCFVLFLNGSPWFHHLLSMLFVFLLLVSRSCLNLLQLLLSSRREWLEAMLSDQRSPLVKEFGYWRSQNKKTLKLVKLCWKTFKDVHTLQYFAVLWNGGLHHVAEGPSNQHWTQQHLAWSTNHQEYFDYIFVTLFNKDWWK